MKFKSLMFVGLAAGSLLLSACNMAGKNPKAGDGAQASQATGVAANSAAAKTYALNDNQTVDGQAGATNADNNYADSDGSDGNYPNMVSNSTKAPQNQTYYFSFNSSGLSRQADMAAVVAQANYLASHSEARIRLEGNTDDRGSREYNIGLGWRRDQTVERILLQHGAAKSQVKMVSYGKERPAVFGSNEGAWRLNRRVNLVYEAT